MNTDSCVVEYPPDLREQAEAVVHDGFPNLKLMSPEDIYDLVHELRVNLAERDLQNAILCKACEEQVRRGTADMERTIENLRQEIAEGEQAQQTIHENERLLSTVLDTLPVGVMVLDREGKIIRINPCSRRIWGKMEYNEADEFRKFKGRRTETGESIQADQWAAVRSLRRGDIILDEENEIEDSEGKHKVILSSAAPLKDENGSIYGAIMVNEDITDRKKAELELRNYHEHLEELVNERTAELESTNSRLKREIEERKQIEKTLRESEERFRITLKNAPINMIIQDRDRRHIWLYDAQSRVKIEDIYNKKEEDIFPPEEAARLIEIKERVMATGTGERVEMPLTPFGRGTVFLDITIEPIRDDRGEVTGVASVNLNITDRKKAEEALRESEIRFRAAVENFPGMFKVYDPDRRILYINSQGAALSGHTPDDVIGKRDEEYLPSGIVDTFLPVLVHAMDTKTPQTMENHLTLPSGEKWFLANFIPLLTDKGNIWQVLGTAIDITERKKAEERSRQLLERMKRLTAQLTASNKELESFSYSISHDLRAPLRSLDGFSQALEEDYADKLDEQARDYLNRIRASAQRMAKLIEDILQLSRTTRAELHYTMVNLSEQAWSIVEELRKAEPDRSVEIIIREGITGEGDENLIRQVLQNLLGNAWKFTSHKKDARIEFAEKSEDGRRVFYVKDNGAGFDMRYTENLFIPFRRLHTEQEFPGTGIGLSIVKRIIERHGGSIRAESEPEKGATFYFTLRNDFQADNH